jgi:hypothetical protein
VSVLEHQAESVDGWSSTAHRAPAVALYVYDATDVDVTAMEILRLSRLAYTPTDGYFLQRHGDLLRPGTTRLRLEVGVYHFKSVRDVQLRIHRPDAVRVLTPGGESARSVSQPGGAAVIGALAVHVCADLPSLDRRLPQSPIRSGRDWLARMSRMCAAAGIRDQRRLIGRDATTARLRQALTEAVADLDPHGLLVLSFAGHSDRRRRDAHGEPVVRWCLYDAGLDLRDLTSLLARVPSTARVIVAADTCYAGAFARHATIGCELVLLAACGDNQTTISGPTSDFALRLEDLVAPDGRPNPAAVTYHWLEQQLRQDTPDAERPVVWTNRNSARTHRPFHFAQPTTARASEGR